MRRSDEAPLLAALRAYVAEGARPFHTPGHKQGRGIDPAFGALIGREALAMDVSLMSELDDLYAPRSCLKEAQDLAAELYGADRSFFVVNGTTGGIQAMIMAVAGPGDVLILPRNAHRSVVGGMALSGVRPAFIQPALDADLGIAMGVTTAAAAAAIAAHPDAKALLLVYPTYYGAAADIAAIAALAHAAGMALLVDEAHGPHLKFSDRLPAAALDAGADISVQSTHKLLGALTQCSMVHCRAGRVDVERLRAMLQLLQSSSPNYLLLASLDAARRQMARCGRETVGRAVELAEWARREINEIDGLYCFGADKVGRPGVHAHDATKLTVTVKGLGLSGAAAERILRRRYRLQLELADAYNVLFLISYADRREDAAALAAALRGLAAGRRPQAVKAAAALLPPPLPPQALTPRQALFAPVETAAFDRSAGRVSAETVAFYPPGIPLLYPGEVVTAELIAYCRDAQARGGYVSGPADGSLATLRVLAGSRGG